MFLDNNFHTIRIVTQSSELRDNIPEKYVEVSWSLNHSNELTHKFLASYAIELKKSWENFILVSYQNSQSKKNHNQDEHWNKILEYSRTWESLLFGGKTWIKQKYKNIQFITDPEWNNIPFEILPDAAKKIDKNPMFISESKEIFRSIRSNSEPIQGKYNSNRKFLLWVPKQKDPNLEYSISREKEIIENNLDQQNVDFDSITHVGTSSSLFFSKLSNYELLHFAGHTEADYIPLFTGKKIFFKDITTLDLSNLKVVFWNSCYSATQNNDIDGLSRKFLQSGVQHFIGFLGPILTGQAEEAGIVFWDTYFKTRDPVKSVKIVRNKLREKFGKSDLTPFLIAIYSTNISESQSFNSSASNILKFRYHQSPKLKRKIIYLIFSLISVLGLLILSLIIDFNNFFHHELISEGDYKNISTTNFNKIPEPKSNINKEKVKSQGNKNTPARTKEDKNTNHLIDPLIDYKLASTSNTHLQSMVEKIKNPIFKNEVQIFLLQDHPIYNSKERKELIQEILNRMHESEEIKFWRFQQKSGL